MKVVIVSSFPFPNGKATANRVRFFAEELIKTGYADEIEIIATTSGQGGIANFAEKIKVVSLYVPVSNKNNLFSMGINEILIAFKLWSIARKAEGNVTIVTVPSALLLLPIAIFPKRGKLVLDVRDVVWTYFSKGTLKGFLGTVISLLFRLAVKKANLVSVTNSHEAKSVEAVSGVEVIVVANGISAEKVKDFQSIRAKPIVGKVNITYIGNVGIAQELDVLIDFSKCYQKDTRIHVVGDGMMLTSLQERCVKERVSNVKFYGLVSPDRVPAYMGQSDILFAQIGKNFISAIPTKIFEYIASGRRILLGLPEGAAKIIFQNFDGVEIFLTGSVNSMKRSYENLILQDFGDEERRRNLERLMSHHIREKSMTNFLLKLNSI